MINVRSIRYRIMSLAGLGIVGMAVIAGTTWQVDRRAQVQYRMGNASREILTATFRAMLLEEQYIRTASKEAAFQHAEPIQRIAQRTGEIVTLASDAAIRDQAEHIAEQGKSVEETFGRLSASAEASISRRQAVEKKMTHIIGNISALLGAIRQEEQTQR